jgi:hypothetical protein
MLQRSKRMVVACMSAGRIMARTRQVQIEVDGVMVEKVFYASDWLK